MTKTDIAVFIACGAFALLGAWLLFTGNSATCAHAFGAAALLPCPFIAEKIFKRKIPAVFKITVALFVFASLIVGRVFGIYDIIPLWDKLLHLASGIILAMCALRIYTVSGAPSSLLAIFALAFSIAGAAIWEIIEFFIDSLFGMDCQIIASGVSDTMLDMIFGLSGSLIFVAAYLAISHIKKRGK